MSNYLIIGSGGREHALAWKISQEIDAAGEKNRVWVAPGNAGIATDPSITGVLNLAENDFDAIEAAVRDLSIDIIVVGPEAPLAAGISDFFQEKGVRLFGPSQAAAQLETSKAFTKEILDAADVKTAEYQVFSDYETALAYLNEAEHPLVVKADGLAAGKGVFVCQDLEDSTDAIHAIFEENRFGDSGSSAIIEKFLDGTELSFMVITDGERIVPLATSRDHKRLLNNNQGPNTGGMGAISPAPTQSEQLFSMVVEDIFKPVLLELGKRNIEYKGFLYAGLMLTGQGPYVLEFNVRMGDPETQAIMLGMTGKISKFIDLATKNDLASLGEDFVVSRELYDGNPACCVVMASGGYPGGGGRGFVIEGIDPSKVETPSTKVFFAGVGEKEGALVNTGGRVLGVAAVATTPEKAQKGAYGLVSTIHWPNEQHRTDIGD